MTSEIRTNSLKSRAGLSTVTLTDSGPMFSGITTFVDNSTFSVGTGGTIHAPSTNTLNIGVNNTESLRIDSNSNLKVAGIVTATHFYGNGANLSGLPAGTTINNYASTRIVTATNNANELDAETNLTVNGSLITFAESTLVVDKGTNPTISTKETAGNKEVQLRANTTGGLLRTVGSYPLVFGIAQVEKMRLDTSGRVLIGTTTEGNSGADDLTIATSGDTGMTIRSGTSSAGGIYFSDGTSGADEYRGIVNYNHGGNYMRLYTDGTERLRITSGGLVGVGQASPTHMLHVDSSNASDSTATAFFKGRIVRVDGAASAHSPRLNLSLDGTDKATILLHRTNDDLEIQTLTASPIRFSPNSTERLRIASDGDTTISASASANFLPGAALNVISDKNVNSGLDDKVNYHLALANPNNDTNEAIGIAFGITDTSTKVGAAIVHQRDAAGSQGHMKFYTRPNNAGPPVERVRIRADGNFYVNSSNNSIVGQPSFYASNNDGCGSYRPHSGFPIHHFYSNAGGTYSLESYVNGNGSYVNLSDYRLKENIVSISNGIDIVKQLNPVKFDWKSSSKTKNDLGFIAHEVQTLIPTAVDGTKDQMKEDGSPFYQGIAQTKMIPYLTAALKEAITKIEKLEQDNIALRVRVTNLEGN